VDDSGIYIAISNYNRVRKVDCNGIITTIAGRGYSDDDVPFDFSMYPHIGPKKKKPLIKPFPQSYLDIVFHFYNQYNEECYESLNKKVKR